MKKVILQKGFKLLFELLTTVSLVFCTLIQGIGIEVKASPGITTTGLIKKQKEVHYITEQELSKLYTCKEDVRNDTCLVVSVEDAEILMKIAVLEDHSDEISQAYIMSIIMNRVKKSGLTIREVVEQDGQFMKLSDKRYKSAEPDVNSHLALALIEGKQIETDFLFYEAKWVKDSWASRHREVACEYGGSRFYK